MVRKSIWDRRGTVQIGNDVVFNELIKKQEVMVGGVLVIKILFNGKNGWIGVDVGWMDLGELEGRLNENLRQFCYMLVWGQIETQVS